MVEVYLLLQVVAMTRELGEDLPHWVGAKEFHQKYESKEVIGRWVSENYRLS